MKVASTISGSGCGGGAGTERREQIRIDSISVGATHGGSYFQLDPTAVKFLSHFISHKRRALSKRDSVQTLTAQRVENMARETRSAMHAVVDFIVLVTRLWRENVGGSLLDAGVAGKANATRTKPTRIYSHPSMRTAVEANEESSNLVLSAGGVHANGMQ